MARKTVAAQLTGRVNFTQNFLAQFINMGIIDRVRWIVFGTTFKPAVGNALLVAIVAILVGLVWLR